MKRLKSYGGTFFHPALINVKQVFPSIAFGATKLKLRDAKDLSEKEVSDHKR